MKKNKPHKLYTRRFWGGFRNDQLHRHLIDRGHDGFGVRLTTGLAIYTSLALARKEYADVRQIEIREIRSARERSRRTLERE